MKPNFRLFFSFLLGLFPIVSAHSDTFTHYIGSREYQDQLAAANLTIQVTKYGNEIGLFRFQKEQFIKNSYFGSLLINSGMKETHLDQFTIEMSLPVFHQIIDFIFLNQVSKIDFDYFPELIQTVDFYFDQNDRELTTELLHQIESKIEASIVENITFLRRILPYIETYDWLSPLKEKTFFAIAQTLQNPLYFEKGPQKNIRRLLEDRSDFLSEQSITRLQDIMYAAWTETDSSSKLQRRTEIEIAKAKLTEKKHLDSIISEIDRTLEEAPANGSIYTLSRLKTFKILKKVLGQPKIEVSNLLTDTIHKTCFLEDGFEYGVHHPNKDIKAYTSHLLNQVFQHYVKQGYHVYWQCESKQSGDEFNGIAFR
jgi:hypothetical protein